MKQSTYPTEKQIQEIGFEIDKIYNHDGYRTNRYKNGPMEVEFTYLNGNIKTFDLTMEEMNCIDISYDNLKKLTEIFKSTPQ